jgi:hypothetical protein
VSNIKIALAIVAHIAIGKRPTPSIGLIKHPTSIATYVFRLSDLLKSESKPLAERSKVRATQKLRSEPLTYFINQLSKGGVLMGSQ